MNSLYEELSELLTHCDFRPNESRVYFAMLQSGFTIPAKIARFCELPRQKIYRVLDDLVSKGACTMVAENRRQYLPVDPGTLIDKVRERMKSLLEVSEKIAPELEELYEKNAERNTHQDNVTILVDPVQIAGLLISLMENAETELLTYTTASIIVPVLKNLDRKRFAELNDKFRTAMENAVVEKAISHISITSKQNINRSILIYKMMEHPDLENLQLRLVESIPCRLQIYDREVVILGIRNDISHQYTLKTLCIRDKALASLLAQGFLAQFEQAKTIEEAGIDDVLEECRTEYSEWLKEQKEDGDET